MLGTTLGSRSRDVGPRTALRRERLKFQATGPRPNKIPLRGGKLMSTSNSLRRAIRYALVAGTATAVVAPVYAQDTEDTNVQEVVVTGSRIAQPNLEGTSPVTMVTAEDIA